MAEPAWSVGKTRQAATASRRAVTGSAESMLRLSAASWRDRAMACCRVALAACRVALAALCTAIPAAVTAVSGEGEEAGDHCVPPARGAAVSAVAGVEEVTFGLAERRVARGIGADPGGGFGGGLQQAAAVEVGRVAGVACPFGCDVVQPGADDPVGVGFGQPGVAQQRPRGQQHLVADLHAVGRQGEQPFGGEGLQDRLHIAHLGWALAVGQFRPGGAVGGVHAVAAGGGQPGEDLPGRRLLAGGEMVVGALGAVGDGPFDAAGAFVVGQGERLPGPGPPGLVQGVRQQRQHSRAQRPRAGGCARRPAGPRPGRRRPGSLPSWPAR